jgi:hypothetical protein
MSNPILTLKDAIRHGEDDLEHLFDQCLRDRHHLLTRIHVKEEIHHELLLSNQKLREHVKELEDELRSKQGQAGCADSGTVCGESPG